MTSVLKTWVLASLAVVPACASHDLIPLERFVAAAEAKPFSLRIEGYCPEAAVNTVFRYRELFANNLSYTIEKGSLLNDLDSDGVADAYETSDLGISHFARDSNNDGYSDLLVWLTGMTLSAQLRLPPTDNTGTDTDTDGLWDGDERLLGTEHDDFDSDDDSIPDGLEARFKSDPLDGADGYLSPGGDGYSNLEKIKMGLPLRETATESIVKSFAVQYELLSQTVTEPPCYDFLVSRIPLAPVSGSNQLRLSFIEENAVGERRLTTRSVAVASQTLKDAVLVYRFQEHQE